MAYDYFEEILPQVEPRSLVEVLQDRPSGPSGPSGPRGAPRESGDFFSMAITLVLLAALVLGLTIHHVCTADEQSAAAVPTQEIGH